MVRCLYIYYGFTARRITQTDFQRMTFFPFFSVSMRLLSVCIQRIMLKGRLGEILACSTGLFRYAWLH